MGLISDSTTQHGLIELPVNSNPVGALTFCDGNRHVPFEIAPFCLAYYVPESSV